MSKTNDHARAHRAYHDVIRQGLPARHPTRVALKERLDRYDAELAAKQAAKRPLEDVPTADVHVMTRSPFPVQRWAARAELEVRKAASIYNSQPSELGNRYAA
jgi:hypothetical protein